MPTFGKTRLRATTLIELLVVVVFLGVATGIVLQAASRTAGDARYAERRFQILKYAQSQLDAVRSSGKTASLTPGTTTTTFTIASLDTSVTLTQTIALVTGYTSLYQVTEACSWLELPFGGGTRSDTLTLAAYVQAPDD